MDADRGGRRLAVWALLAAMVASLVAGGVALVVAWEHFEAPPARVATPERGPSARLDEIDGRLDELSRRLDDFESLPLALDAPPFEGPQREEVERRSDVAAEPEAASADERERDSARSVVRRLARLDDPQERLALARELVQSTNPLEQLAGARVLAELAPAEAFGLVDGWLAEVRAGTRSDWFVVDAARALEEQGDPRCMESWVASLEPDRSASDVATRRRAVFKLGTTRSASVTPLLVSSLADASAEVRVAALDGLRTSGAPSAIAAVEPLLDDPVGAVRDRAVRTLETLRRRQEPPPERERDSLRDRLRRRRS
jgi:hypothetical protein